MAFPVVLPATSITIASVKEKWFRDETVTNSLLGFHTISIAVVASYGTVILESEVANVVCQA